MSYAMKQFETEHGPLVLEFDFIPAEPTTLQLGMFVPHNCTTCEWKPCKTGCSRGADNIPGVDPCKNWEIGPAAFETAYIEYYKDLHRKRYGSA